MTITFSLEGLDLATQQGIKEKAAVHLAKAIAAQQALGHSRAQTTGIYAKQKQKTSMQNTLAAWKTLENQPKKDE